MEQITIYHITRHLDAPKRLLSLTMDEFVIAAIVMMLLISVSQKLLVVLIGGAFVCLLRLVKRGKSPRYLLLLMYWFLPYTIMKYFLPRLPASNLRLWLA